MNSETVRPWWKFGHVWMVIAGPLIVVVAGFVTLYLAIRTPDPVLPTTPVRAESGPASSTNPGMTPANAARNHAATGGTPPPSKP